MNSLIKETEDVNSDTVREKLSENQLELAELGKTVVQKFKQKSLYKGFSEVLKGIYERKKITDIYISGKLDFWYENTLIKSLQQTDSEHKIKLHYLPEKQKRFVYDHLKDISVTDEPRKKSRRFYYTRVFAI